ncbi:hypothetical protein ACH429_14510 [Streptomyces pathocidini]|uniref:Uncharacterized protein n=1 Tax=Streptomyces pathocidini TaxID=1650571 RepID=A0ABW7UUB1_9ACTN
METTAVEPAHAALAGGQPAPMTVAADGSYAARMVTGAEPGSWYPERWTLDGPEPYAVPLPLAQPEEPDSDLLPLADGRVLIRRRVADRHDLALLYPAGPGTGELPIGAVECERLALLPPAPDGTTAYALAYGGSDAETTALWLVHGGAFGPERIAELPGRCTGGAWLDRTGRLLALDQRLDPGADDGRVKAVAVDLGRGGELSPLLEIAEGSNDRLLLADPDSGLLLVRSDAPGHDRLGWGVLGGTRPIRFPEALRLADAAVTPFAIQPGQALTPETCAVALRIDGAAGTWVGVWRPSERRLHQLTAPDGWLAGTGLWTREGRLQLPYATADVPCGVAWLAAPDEPEETEDGPQPTGQTLEPTAWQAPAPTTEPSYGYGPAAAPLPPRPVPLQQAPMAQHIGKTTASTR